MSVGVSTEQRSEGYVLVGIPAYNEEATVAEVVEAASAYADEVVVVDDGSSDTTSVRASDAGATVLSHEQNRGYGATLGSIFQYAHANDVAHLVIIDADGQHDVNDIPDLVRAQQETTAQIVTGSRFANRSAGNIPAYRRFGLAVINLLTNAGLRLGYSYSTVSDTQCGFRAYDQEAITALANDEQIGSGMGASLDILFQAAREGYDIVEVPTRIDYEVSNASSHNPVAHGLNLIKSLFISICRDRPTRALSLCFAGLATILLFLFGVVQFGFGVVVMVPLIISLGLLVTLSSRSPVHSDSADQ